MTDLAALQQRIVALILEGIHVEVPSVDLDLFDSGVLDSLAFVELLVQLEAAFAIRIPIAELDIDRFRTVDRIAEFVASSNGRVTSPSTPAGRDPQVVGAS